MSFQEKAAAYAERDADYWTAVYPALKELDRKMLTNLLKIAYMTGSSDGSLETLRKVVAA